MKARFVVLLSLILMTVLPALRAATVLEEWEKVQSDRNKEYRSMIAANGLQDDSPLSVTEWSQFYNLTGGGYYMNKFNLRLYDIIKVGGFGSLIYGMGFVLALFGAFGGFGKPKQAQELPGILVVSALCGITYIGAPQIYASAQVLKDAIPTILGVGIKKAKAANNNVSYLLQTANLCGPNAQVPALALQQGVNEALESRGVVLNENNLVATMQLYNMYAAHVNTQLAVIKKQSSANIPDFDLAEMGKHKPTFDGKLIDVSGSDANSSVELSSFCATRKIQPETDAFLAGYSSIGDLKTVEAAESLDSWPAYLTGELPRLIKVYGSAMMKGRGMPLGYPLADNIWSAKGLEQVVLDYFHDLQDGKLTDQIQIDKVARKIRETVRTETAAFIDYAFILQMQHHAYPSVRQRTAERYTPAEPQSMYLKMCHWMGSMVKKAAELPDNASRWFSGMWNGLITSMCEGGWVVPLIVRFAQMFLDISVEASVFVIIACAPCVMIPSLRAVVMGQVNVVLTLCITSGVLLFVLCVWEGVMIAVGVYVFGYDPTSVSSALKMGGAAIGTIMFPMLAAQLAFWAIIGMWVAKVVGYILFALSARKVTAAILRGEAWVGGLMARGFTALGAGTLAAGAGFSAGMLAGGAKLAGAGWKPMAKGLFTGGPWKPPSGAMSGGASSVGSNASASSSAPSSAGGGAAPNAGGSVNDGGATAAPSPATANLETAVSPTLTPSMGSAVTTNVGPVSGAFSRSQSRGLLERAASSVRGVASNDALKAGWEAAKVPLREISHAVQSGGDPAKYLKMRTQAKAAREETEAQSEHSRRDPAANELPTRSTGTSSVSSPASSAAVSSSGSGENSAQPMPTYQPMQTASQSRRKPPRSTRAGDETNQQDFFEEGPAPQIVRVQKKAK